MGLLIRQVGLILLNVIKGLLAMSSLKKKKKCRVGGERRVESLRAGFSKDSKLILTLGKIWLLLIVASRIRHWMAAKI